MKIQRGIIKVWLPVILVLLAAVGGYFLYYRPSSRVQERLNRIRASGEPVTLSELNAYYAAVPFQENAAAIISEAFLQMRDHPELDRADLPARGEPLTPELKRIIRESLELNGPALEAVEKGLAFDQSRYPIDMRAGAAMLLPHLVKIKGLADRFRRQALLAGEEDDTEGAVRAIENGVRLTGTLRNEPILISQMVRMACAYVALSALERLLSTQALNEAQLVRLSKVFAEAENWEHDSLRVALIGERCFGIDLFKMKPAQVAAALGLNAPNTATGSINAVPLQLYQMTGVRNLDFLFYLDFMERWVELSANPGPGTLEAAEAAEQELLQQLERRPFAFLTKQLLPVLSNVFEKREHARARIASARTALAIERFRSAGSGEPPEVLDEAQLGMAVPSDPFDGRPLRYKRLPKGYVVYSIGEDKQDDGGTERGSEKGRRTRTFDVTFTVER